MFDIRLDGFIASEPGQHLDAAQKVVRTKLVVEVEQQRASGLEEDEAIAAYLRGSEPTRPR